MSLIEAYSATARTMADGTLRLSVDIEPRHAQDAFKLFGAPGTPMVLGRLVSAHEQSPEPEKPKGGPLAKLAGQWCKDERFFEFIWPIYDKWMGGNGTAYGDVSPQDFEDGKAGYCRHCILALCDVDSRAQLDHNADAAKVFHERIREPFSQYLKKAG